MTIEFKAWPKTSRLNSRVTISEKLNGSNGAVIFDITEETPPDGQEVMIHNYAVAAQTRTRLVTVHDDQTGIAKWVTQNYETLIQDIGLPNPIPKTGTFYHYGEFMTRGHKEPHFYLFNTRRWAGKEFETPTLKVVPVLYEGDYYEGVVEECLDDLRTNGSRVHPGIPAEGVVVYWQHDDTMKKAFIDTDAKGK